MDNALNEGVKPGSVSSGPQSGGAPAPADGSPSAMQSGPQSGGEQGPAGAFSGGFDQVFSGAGASLFGSRTNTANVQQNHAGEADLGMDTPPPKK
jgi:hypothetical protein